MARPDRRLIRLVILYAALSLGWLAFAQWIVPPMLIQEHPGRIIALVNQSVQNVPAPFVTRDLLGCWREFASAMLIVLILHFTIVLILRRYELQGDPGRSPADIRLERRGHFVLLVVALAFLVTTVVCGARQDYFLYLQMWYEVRLGHDPWFTVFGEFGDAPLNAYGPLFNFLAAVAWVNPLAPKVLFAYAYVLFAISETKCFTASRPPGVVALIVLTGLFWNPFPWVEIAGRGHFDILVGLLCLGSIRAWSRGHDVRAGMSLALGVLLKYMPVVLLPFLALDRGRLRTRFLQVAVVSIALGLAMSCYVWGPSTLSPLGFAARRRAALLSIFRFLRGVNSPLNWFGVGGNYDFLAPIVMALALLRACWWSWVRRPDVEASALVAMVTMVLFYPTGFPQYQMVPFVLGSSWAVRHWDLIRGRPLRILAIAGYFGWLGVFDAHYGYFGDGATVCGFMVEETAGLPAFLFGWMFLVSVVRSEDEAIEHRRENRDGAELSVAAPTPS